MNDWEEKALNPRMAHPWPEHLYPLHVAMGAPGDDAKAEKIQTSWTSTLSYSSYRFTYSMLNVCFHLFWLFSGQVFVYFISL